MAKVSMLQVGRYTAGVMTMLFKAAESGLQEAAKGREQLGIIGEKEDNRRYDKRYCAYAMVYDPLRPKEENGWSSCVRADGSVDLDRMAGVLGSAHDITCDAKMYDVLQKELSKKHVEGVAFTEVYMERGRMVQKAHFVVSEADRAKAREAVDRLNRGIPAPEMGNREFLDYARASNQMTVKATVDRDEYGALAARITDAGEDVKFSAREEADGRYSVYVLENDTPALKRAVAWIDAVQAGPLGKAMAEAEKERDRNTRECLEFLLDGGKTGIVYSGDPTRYISTGPEGLRIHAGGAAVEVGRDESAEGLLYEQIRQYGAPKVISLADSKEMAKRLEEEAERFGEEREDGPAARAARYKKETAEALATVAGTRKRADRNAEKGMSPEELSALKEQINTLMNAIWQGIGENDQELRSQAHSDLSKGTRQAGAKGGQTHLEISDVLDDVFVKDTRTGRYVTDPGTDMSKYAGSGEPGVIAAAWLLKAARVQDMEPDVRNGFVRTMAESGVFERLGNEEPEVVGAYLSDSVLTAEEISSIDDLTITRVEEKDLEHELTEERSEMHAEYQQEEEI